ncbi:hypothetical protein FDP41_006001 [Naegleria fowleri]|uniref:Uncharacterized protein n=1 Tax=Naegleria fowleri TaxID=5763 RepID=A0A6A5BQK6_NAEFO|nr:uncharacterized protein FDP41_006001 [Naegleria fowleri]KAF0975249.1 hypothetical protein FDP41_006001 [Naegleria fowleri]
MSNVSQIPSPNVLIEGKYITLQPCNPSQDAPELYEMSHGSPEKESIWEYLYMGGSKVPFHSVQDFQQFMEKRVERWFLEEYRMV